jgi:hypothetical protein
MEKCFGVWVWALNYDFGFENIAKVSISGKGHGVCKRHALHLWTYVWLKDLQPVDIYGSKRHITNSPLANTT